MAGEAKATSPSSPPTTTLSAHQPFERFPAIIKQAVREAGGVAQFAGGVPAMCDGVTQGPGRHGAVAVLARRDRARDGGGAQPRHVRRGALLGICDKIVPGLAMAAPELRAPAGVFVPGGPMTTGLPNSEKSASASSTPRARSAARSCSRPRAPPTTAPAPAPSTAPPTPTRCSWRSWACTCPALPSSTRTRPCATRSPP